MPDFESGLTDRQRRELEYHRQRANDHRQLLARPFSWEVLEQPGRRWWNAYWQMFACLTDAGLANAKVLVVGCGFGDDALRLAKLGADVTAFDLSGESLAIANELARREHLQVAFDRMAAEQLTYESDSFDCIVARDILHHVDIPRAIREIARVARPNALFVVNEIYSHSLTERIRRSAIVSRLLYPRMQRMIYNGAVPYITRDERKLDERDIAAITTHLEPQETRKYFNLLVGRIVPDRYDAFAKLDRSLLRMLQPLAPVLAGRILMAAHIVK